MSFWEQVRAWAEVRFPKVFCESVPSIQTLELPSGAIWSSNEIAVVCAYFNPFSLESRRQNLKEFVRGLLPTLGPSSLLIVEWSPKNEYEVEKVLDLSDPRIHQIRVGGGSYLWQKERLLNIGFRYLSTLGTKKAVWLDADVRMSDPLWLKKTADQLDHSNLCQVFSRSARTLPSKKIQWREGVASRFLSDRTLRLHGLSCGYGWASHVPLLLRVPLYEGTVLGGGDAALWLATIRWIDPKLWGRSKIWIRFYRNLGPKLKGDFLEWADRFGAEVLGRISFVDQDLFSESHGDVQAKRYGGRYKKFKRFDPKTDLKNLDSTDVQALAWKAPCELEKVAYDYLFFRDA